MDHETLFTASKWDILKQLESGPASPLELANACGTSIANISQQLRLLMMAGLVTSERVPNRDKGKPRVLYSLAGNMSYMIATADNFVDKKAVQLSDYNKIIMRMWFHPRAELRYVLEKAFWRIEDHFDKIDFLAVDATKDSPLTFYYKTNSKKLDVKPFTLKDLSGNTHQVVFTQELPPLEDVSVLYDPTGVARDTNDNKGGYQ